MKENMTYNELYEKYLESQEKLQYYEEYDLLTGCYNKQTFYQKVNQLLETAKPDQYMLVCVDVERFKVINDIFGTAGGNRLLQYLAENLQRDVFCSSAVFGRLSADIFVACMKADDETEAVEQAVITVFKNAPLEMEVVPAIGIYRIRERKLSVETMCDRAILALNTIKGDYQHHCIIFNEELWNHLMQEQEIVSRAGHALETGEFEIYMQPKCNMKTGRIVGAEALVRWNHPDKGLISPALFIPVFERNGFIKRLDTYIWESVVRWIKDWISQGKKAIPISVNVSRMDIIGMNLSEVLEEILTRYEVPAELIELEITETAYSTHLDEIIITVEKLMYSGYTVLMDDFGSGYSSLNMLKDINIDILKLDMRFLDSTNQKSRDILDSIVQMAKWLNLRIIAEGVETEDQVDFLVDVGCEYAQGYYYYKPMSLEEFDTLLRNEEKIDYEDKQRLTAGGEKFIKFKDLFHADMMSEKLLNNILGAVALYQYDGAGIHIIKGNSAYFDLLYKDRVVTDLAEIDVAGQILKEDQELFFSSLRKAREKKEKGAEVIVRRKLENCEIIWLQLRLFYLAEINGKGVYYAGVSDETSHMQAVEALEKMRHKT